MAIELPEDYELNPNNDPKIVFGPDYQAWTVGVLRQLLEGFSDEAMVWIADYPDAGDGAYVRPLESFAGSGSASPHEYVIL